MEDVSYQGIKNFLIKVRYSSLNVRHKKVVKLYGYTIKSKRDGIQN